MTSSIMPGAETIKLDGNSTNVLMLHGGGGGTTPDLKEIAQFLHDKAGYSVLVPRLPGFGTTPEDLLNTPYQTWIDFVQDELAAIKEKCEKVFVYGHSMGSVLAAILAERNEITGLILTSPALKLKFPLQVGSKLAPILKLFGKKFISMNPEENIRKSGGVWIGYDRLPVDQGLKIIKLSNIMKRDLDKIRAPTCIICGRNDDMIDLKSPTRIHDALTVQDKEIHWIEGADHALMFHERKMELFQITLNFIQRIEKG
ncbi:MAG: alpha/beta hydrolase [Candidatus Helarchaeota archaeon]